MDWSSSNSICSYHKLEQIELDELALTSSLLKVDWGLDKTFSLTMVWTLVGTCQFTGIINKWFCRKHWLSSSSFLYVLDGMKIGVCWQIKIFWRLGNWILQEFLYDWPNRSVTSQMKLCGTEPTQSLPQIA